MITILEVCEAYGGGVKRHIDHLYNYLNTGHIKLQPLVSSTRTEQPINENYLVNDKLSKFYHPLCLFQVLAQLKQICREQDINVIHAHSSYSGVIIFLYSLLIDPKIKILFTPHAYYSEKKLGWFKQKIILFIEKLVVSRMHMVIHVSKDEQIYALKQKLVTPDKSVIINNGVIQPKNCYYTDKDPIVLSVARTDEQKNPFEFIEIAYKVLKKQPKAKFIYVGGGELLEDARHVVTKLGLSNNINFCGHSDQVDTYYRQAKVYLSTSTYEGQPFSVIDALAYRIPIVLSDVTGHANLVTNQNGQLYQLHDIDQAAAMINQYLESDNQNESQQGFALYMEKFRLDYMINQLASCYRQQYPARY